MNGVVYYGATWCPPCIGYLPIIESIDLEYPDLLFTYKDVDDFPSETEALSIDAVPTLILIRDGNEVHRISNSTSAENVRAAIDQYILQESLPNNNNSSTGPVTENILYSALMLLGVFMYYKRTNQL